MQSTWRDTIAGINNRVIAPIRERSVFMLVVDSMKVLPLRIISSADISRSGLRDFTWHRWRNSGVPCRTRQSNGGINRPRRLKTGGNLSLEVAEEIKRPSVVRVTFDRVEDPRRRLRGQRNAAAIWFSRESSEISWLLSIRDKLQSDSGFRSRSRDVTTLRVCIVSRDGRRDAERHDGCLSVSLCPGRGHAYPWVKSSPSQTTTPCCPPFSLPSPTLPCQLGSNVRDSARAVPWNLRRGSDYRVAW